MKNINFLLSIICLSILGTSCKKFEHFQTDPNKFNQATPELVLNTVSQQLFQEINPEIGLVTRQLVFTDGSSPLQYYFWNRKDFEPYYAKLTQVERLASEATRTHKPEYMPIVLFAKAYHYFQLTQLFGDVPYDQVNNGNFSPKYESQENIINSILIDLKKANELITAQTTPVSGDQIYQGNMLQWKKLINSFTLRVLMSLSIKENNQNLNIKNKFNEIFNHSSIYPLMSNNIDNGQLSFLDLTNNRYPYFNSNSLQTAYYMEESFVNLLKVTQDPRLFTFAAPFQKSNGLVSNYDNYKGVKASDLSNIVSTDAKSGFSSSLNNRFYHEPINEASIGMSYSELQLILAEAVVRKWIPGNAQSYYQNAIKASFKYYKLSDEQANQYLTKNPLEQNKELKQIITQKYIGSFMNNGWLPYFENRRTGFPIFDVSGNGVLNNKKIPKRFMYPASELQYNQNNVAEAIKKQFPEGDQINAEMWLLKP